MPCLPRMRCICLDTSPSMVGRMRSRNSTTVTCAPRRPQTEPSSSPITPPPMTTRRFGTSGSSRAPVEETIFCSSISMPGSGVTSEPVAMTMALDAVMVPTPSTSTVFGAVMRPAPFSQAILFFLNRNSMPPVFSLTTLSLWDSMPGRSSSTPPTLMPNLARPCLASSYFSDAASSALEGMQPTFRQVPPSALRFSTQATLKPSCAARIAQTYPPGPPPTTTTSKVLSAIGGFPSAIFVFAKSLPVQRGGPRADLCRRSRQLATGQFVRGEGCRVERPAWELPEPVPKRTEPGLAPRSHHTETATRNRRGAPPWATFARVVT